MKKRPALRSVFVLTAICLITAAILGAINYVTAPIIEKAEYEKEQAALKEVLPSGENFTALDLSTLSLNDKIKAVYSEDNGGYAFKITVKGYKSALTDRILSVGRELDALERRMLNPRYVDKAPKALVEETRKGIEEKKSLISRLRAELDLIT